MLNSFAITDPETLSDKSIDLVNLQVITMDPESKEVFLSDGSSVSTKSIIITTGALPNRLFNLDTLVIRTARDGELLRNQLDSISSAAVIGSGVLGIEVADQLIRSGKAVTIFCKSSMFMHCELNAHASQYVRKVTSDAGVLCRFNSRINTIVPAGKKYCIESGDEKLTFDTIVECTGSKPNISLAQKIGIKTDKGILTNQYLQTSDPVIFAAGDCVQSTDEVTIHLWHQAQDQGVVAGRNVAAFLDNKEMQVNLAIPRRLKCEAFGMYLFSINTQKNRNGIDFQTFSNDTIYQEFGYKSDRLVSVVMYGDKPRAKLYEQAIREGISSIEVKNTFHR